MTELYLEARGHSKKSSYVAEIGAHAIHVTITEMVNISYRRLFGVLPAAYSQEAKFTYHVTAIKCSILSITRQEKLQNQPNQHQKEGLQKGGGLQPGPNVLGVCRARRSEAEFFVH